MSVPVVFNRRIGKNEIAPLLDIIDDTEDCGVIHRRQASVFLQLKEAIGFISSVDNDTMGGTIVYRDRTRLGMAIAAIGIKREYQDSGIYTIIKSSLPFFRTVAIRDVDVIVAERPLSDNLGFPFSFCLPTWTLPVLERIGFAEEKKLFSCTFKIDPETLLDFREIQWDNEINSEGAKSLIWDEGRRLGLMNSLTWMSLDFSIHSKTLHTLTDGASTKIIASISNLEKTKIISLFATREQFERSNGAAGILTSIIKTMRASNVRFPMVGEGQIEMLKSVTDQIGGILKIESLMHMRRRL